MNYDDYMVSVPFGSSGRWTIEPWELDGRVYRRLLRAGTVVMTDTPDEVDAHMEVISRARGRVLITGLGLGMVLQACLRKPEVQSVDVIEIDADVLFLVASHYRDERLRIHHADAFTFPLADADYNYIWDVVWHDIWDDADHDRSADIAALFGKYGAHAGWQGAWKWGG